MSQPADHSRLRIVHRLNVLPDVGFRAFTEPKLMKPCSFEKIPIHIGLSIVERFGCVVTFRHAGEEIANERREPLPYATSATEAGWRQSLDVMAAAWE